jgi:hypothetical protein
LVLAPRMNGDWVSASLSFRRGGIASSRSSASNKVAAASSCGTGRSAADPRNLVGRGSRRAAPRATQLLSGRTFVGSFKSILVIGAARAVRLGRSLALPIAILLMTTGSNAEDAVPTGFKADRYQGLWEHNPFTLVTPAAPTQPETFSRYSVVSWLNEGGKNSLFVQDGDTNDVQKVSETPNEKGLRLVEVHAKGGKDFQMIRDFEAVISNGTEQGTIKFKPQASAPIVAGNPMNPMQMPMQMEGGKNVQQQMQLPQQINAPVPNANLLPNANAQPSAPYASQNGNIPPRAQQIRRKRVLPSPAVNITPGVPQPPNGINQGQ